MSTLLLLGGHDVPMPKPMRAYQIRGADIQPRIRCPPCSSSGSSSPASGWITRRRRTTPSWFPRSEKMCVCDFYLFREKPRCPLCRRSNSSRLYPPSLVGDGTDQGVISWLSSRMAMAEDTQRLDHLCSEQLSLAGAARLSRPGCQEAGPGLAAVRGAWLRIRHRPGEHGAGQRLRKQHEGPKASHRRGRGRARWEGSEGSAQDRPEGVARARARAWAWAWAEAHTSACAGARAGGRAGTQARSCEDEAETESHKYKRDGRKGAEGREGERDKWRGRSGGKGERGQEDKDDSSPGLP